MSRLFVNLQTWFGPLLDAVFLWNLPWTYRWRLLAFQPLALIAYAIAASPYVFSRPFTVDWLPVAAHRNLRVLVFKAPRRGGDDTKLRPLHLDCHAGAFIGGLPESGAAFCARVARETGAVVISTSYRHAPRNPFPAAIDDVDTIVAFLQTHAASRYGADPSLMTVSGYSAGGNLALATSLSVPGRVKASVTFYAAIELRLSPWEKPKSPSFPRWDPSSFMLPLYDSYAGPVRAQNLDNPRLSPAIASIHNLPEHILMVVPGIDILVHEQTAFIQRLQEEAAVKFGSSGRRFEILYEEKAFHGYLELPSIIVPQERKDRVFGPGVRFIRDAHEQYGWQWTT